MAVTSSTQAERESSRSLEPKTSRFDPETTTNISSSQPIPPSSRAPDSSPSTETDNIQDVVDAVLREDEARKNASLQSNVAAERSRSRSRNRPVSAGSGQERKQNLWDQDKEKKNRKLVRRLLDHRLVPGFLK